MLNPDLYLTSVFEITPKVLNALEVVAIILDVDNTIRQHKEFEIYDGVLNWVEEMKKAGFLLVIASNNFEKNIKPVADVLNLPYVSLCFKPFPVGLSKAVKKLNVKSKNIVIVGDQFFTDVVGGKLQGFKTILIKPLKLEKGFFWKIRRKLEKAVLHIFQKRR